MNCRDPYNKSGPQGSYLFPCGQCMPCRINRRREWTHRIMLEKKLHADTCFVTLTYADEHLRISATGYPTLDRLHLQHWLKRFRAAIAPLKIRFYACGEYGEKSERPHYHVAIFGFPMCTAGRTKKDVRTKRPLWETCCWKCKLIGDSWGLGDVDLGELNTDSAQYIAGYVTKKMTKADDSRLKGRYPEFGQPSLRPGIGAGFMPFVAEGINALAVDLVEMEGDVPSSLRHGKRIMPLGRYLRRRLRLEVGLDASAPQVTLDRAQEALQPLRDRAFENSSSFKKEVLAEFDGKVRQLEYRYQLKKRKGSL